MPVFPPGGAYLLAVGDTVFSPPTTAAMLTLQFISLPAFHLEVRRILVFLIKLSFFLKQIFYTPNTGKFCSFFMSKKLLASSLDISITDETLSYPNSIMSFLQKSSASFRVGCFTPMIQILYSSFELSFRVKLIS